MRFAHIYYDIDDFTIEERLITAITLIYTARS